MVSEKEFEGLGVYKQYTASENVEKIYREAEKVFAEKEGKFVFYRGYQGRIKRVGVKDGRHKYGFFKKGAKTKYRPLEYSSIVTNSFST